MEDTSALLPIETNADSPSPRAAASARKARPSAPLCDEKPMLPAGMAAGPNVALRRAAEAATPRQLGPISRPPCDRTSASRASWRCAPSAPVSANPAEITHSARTPRRSAASAASITRSAGTAMTARSSGSGTSAIEAYARTPETGSACGLTGCAAPAKSPATMLRNSSPPIDPRRAEAPTTATPAGAKNGASDAVTARWSRRSTRSM